MDDAILGLQLLQVKSEDEARRMLALWSRRDQLTDAQVETVVRAVLGGEYDWRRPPAP